MLMSMMLQQVTSPYNVDIVVIVVDVDVVAAVYLLDRLAPAGSQVIFPCNFWGLLLIL